MIGRTNRLLVLLAAVEWLVAFCADAAQMTPGPGLAESVQLADGSQVVGFVESEDDHWVYAVELRPHAGGQPRLALRIIDRQQVTLVNRLDPRRRETLRRQMAPLRLRAEVEPISIESVELEESSRPAPPGFRYTGRWFIARCATDRTIARRLVVRMEQAYAAYRCVLTPRTEPGRPLEVVVFGSSDQYQTYLAQRGLRTAARAVFFPEDNLVVAGSELDRFATERQHLYAEHERLKGELAQLRSQLAERLQTLGRQLRARGAPRSHIGRLLRREKRQAEERIQEKEKAIERIQRHNVEAFEEAAQETLVRLYHEMFHAYLDNHVYPHQRYCVPCWLDEGLAMIAETGRLPSGAFRLGRLNPRALDRLEKDGPLRLREILQSDGHDFLAIGHDSSDRSQSYYASAWALTYYLVFERHLLDTDALDRYVSRQASELPPDERFRELIGEPLGDFETAWRRYISQWF
ncbi:MAG TPA: DUF1570 domain-containing protein [Planctomycetaceae bacterium]|nr:DUF1570 domain-containing protein [Planctomycetaceae bacterium]